MFHTRQPVWDLPSTVFNENCHSSSQHFVYILPILIASFCPQPLKGTALHPMLALSIYLLTYFLAGTPVELSDHGNQKCDFFDQQKHWISF